MHTTEGLRVRVDVHRHPAGRVRRPIEDIRYSVAGVVRARTLRVAGDTNVTLWDPSLPPREVLHGDPSRRVLEPDDAHDAAVDLARASAARPGHHPRKDTDRR